MSKPMAWFVNENVFCRIAIVWILIFGLLPVAWIASYYILPVGAIREMVPAANLPTGNSFLTVFLPIFLYSFFITSGVIMVCNLLSAKGFPLGYCFTFIIMILYGVLLGTNSFIDGDAKIFPSMEFFTRAGFYELNAYVLIAAATAKLTMWNQTGWLSGNLERVKTRRSLKLKKTEVSVLIIGIVLLLIAAIIESIGHFNRLF